MSPPLEAAPPNESSDPMTVRMAYGDSDRPRTDIVTATIWRPVSLAARVRPARRPDGTDRSAAYHGSKSDFGVP